MHHHRRKLLFPALLVPLAGVLALSIGGCPTTPTDPNTNPPTQTGDSGLTGKFVGSARCQLCHRSAHTDWAGTLHATALETLEDIGKGTDAACLACHTVGFGEEGGFTSRATTNSLAGVGCESCHGPGRDHVEDPSNEALLPPISLSSDVCSTCHTSDFHPTGDDWHSSKHAEIQPSLVEEFFEGVNASSCGVCHSGDVFVAKVNGQTVGNDFLKDVPEEEMTPISCAVCHDPHKKTGNAITPEDGRDYQLRFAQVKFTTPTNTIAAATDPTRFNLCGQCHHARNRVWTDSSREPHPSDQVNVFFGEMPLPDSNLTPIVQPRVSVHLNAVEQCSTCHVFRKPAVEGFAPAVSGHSFEVNYEGCVDCHGTAEIAQAKTEGLKIEIDSRVAVIKTLLDAWGNANVIDGKGALSWEFTSEGGPASSGQTKVPDNIKKARYIYYYVTAGGGNGAHNPDYVRDALIAAENYVRTAPARLP